MAPPRKPAKLQERSGAWRKDPQRRRKDVPGKGSIPATAPAYLGLSAVQARIYEHLVTVIPEGVGSESDVYVVELAARLLASVRKNPAPKPALAAQLRAIYNALGMTPAARAALGAGGEQKNANPFQEFGRGKAGAQREGAPN